MTTAKDAIESGRQRVLLERAEQLKVTLQDVPKSDISRSINLLLDLSGELSHAFTCTGQLTLLQLA